MRQSGDANQPLKQTVASDMKVTTVGIDLAKNVFQLHRVNEFGKSVMKKQIRRDQMAELDAKSEKYKAGRTEQPIAQAIMK